MHRRLLGEARPCPDAGSGVQAIVRACSMRNVTIWLGYGLFGPEAYRSVTSRAPHTIIPRYKAYSVPYVEPLSDARTKLEDFFNILLEVPPDMRSIQVALDAYGHAGWERVAFEMKELRGPG